MKINILKRGAILLIAVIMCLSTFVSVGTLNSFADEVPEQDKTVVFSFPRDVDENYSAEWGHEELHYMNGWSQKESKRTHIYAIGSWEGNICYCIEPGTPIDNDQTVNSTGEDYWDNYPAEYNKTITPYYIKMHIGRIMQYGYCGTVTTSWRSHNEEDADKMSHAIATQLLIWETIVGERDEDFNHVDAGSYDAVLDVISINHPLHDRIMTYYNSMVESVQNHSKVPSFFKKSSLSAQVVTLSWNGSKYTATLTDTNNVLGNYTFTTNNSNVTCSVSGNKLTVSSNTAINSEVTITANKTNSKRKGMVVWGDGIYDTGTGDIQDLVTFSAEVDDPVVGYMKVKASSGSAKIVKTSEDGKVSGVKFTVVGNGINTTVTTNSNGEITVPNLTAGTYTVTEVVGNIYEPQESRTVTVVAGQTATVNFNNTLKRGNLVVTKTSEDGLVSGIKFRLYGTADNGLSVNEYAVTDSSGKAYFNDVLIGSSYTLVEVDTESYYITPIAQTVKIEWNKATNNTVNNVLKLSELKVTKTAEDGMVEGITFRLYGTAECGQYVDVYATTDKSGKAYFKDILIGSAYTIEECNVSEKYITPIAQTNVVIEWEKVTQTTFENVLKRGDLKVTKTAEDSLVEGLTFHLYGYSLSGIYVDEYAVTNGNGIAEFKDILIGRNYTLEESNCPDRYVVPELQDAAIEWNNVTNKSFHNILKKWNAEVYKVDSEYDNPQGDATLEGAVYGVYKGDVLIDRYTTDENGYFITEYYPCGDDWTISEISPSEGYLLDETVYDVGAEANKYTVELNTKQFTVKETVVKGSISIIKHCDDGSTQIETPEVGAEFQVFLSSALSYENAKETERDILVCDEHGYAQTKDLPYGIYTVRQTKGWDGRDLMPEFTVVIDENGKAYRYLINNSVFESFVQIIKVDAETGNTIPYAGAGFKIYDPNGKLITMTLTYPEVVTVDTFYTSENGYLITPESLEYGVGYYLIEEQAPYGYILDKTPVYFDITEYNSTTENAVTVVKVTKENTAQKGIIKITKSGEVFSSVIEVDGMYKPVYAVSGLAGAVYEITAAEDIITLDGTVRYTKGEVVATLTTDENGYAESQPLYLGKFIVREVTAPYGMVLNTEPVSVELTYAGQEVAITDTSASFVNDRQKISIDLIKSMEKDELFGIGNNDEMLSVKFALYAARDIVASDETMIPKGCFIEIASCDVEGKLTFNTDMPVGSVVIIKEYSTDKHYILHEGEFLVVFDYAGQDEKIVHVTLNDCADITNEIIRGTVIGKKIDEDSFSIAGALFGLFKPDETAFTEEMALMVSESNEIGVFGFENVPYGNWIIRELKPAPAFVLNEEIYEVNISEDEQIVEITAVNRFICGCVRVWKVDEEVPDSKLSNAVFAVYCDVDGNGEFNAEIDMLVGELNELEAGLYGMDDLRYNGYFLHEEKAPDGFIKDDNYYYFEIRNDGEVIYIDNKVGAGFTNTPQKGNLKIVKTSNDGKVEGFSFRVTNEEYGYDEVFTTDANGEIFIEELRIGKYTVSEVVDDISINYIRPEDVITTVETNDTAIVTMNNVLIDIPKTGDERNIHIWYALAGVSVIGIIGMTVYLFRKKKRGGF